MAESHKQIAVVVGVGAGLGLALARRFASAYTVALVARGKEKLEESPLKSKLREGACSRSRRT
jgi:NADP-dependent 3-hydroxy acid dehydrogenase YdfG